MSGPCKSGSSSVCPSYIHFCVHLCRQQLMTAVHLRKQLMTAVQLCKQQLMIFLQLWKQSNTLQSVCDITLVKFMLHTASTYYLVQCVINLSNIHVL